MADKKRFAVRGGGSVVGVIALAVLLNGLVPSGATATHEPANKVSASGSETEVFGPGENVVLLSEMVKTSKPSDLILAVSLECALTTDVTTVGNDSERAFGEVQIEVRIDGKPVPVSAENADAGRVVFCNRAYARETSLFDDDDATIKTFFSSRTATAFNWMALDVGSATHKIEVIGHLTETATSGANAQAVVGNRTLIVEPTKAANDEAVTTLG